ncbi:MAG TPA: hypothetical protein VGJ60_07465 [Chloroflexota bacterium]|jgi:hypothetical protein
MSRDHILVHDRDMSVHCTICGDRMRLDLPVHIDVWLAAAQKFTELHAGCAPRTEATS